MPVNECIPYMLPGHARTANCSTAVTGKTFVKIVAARSGGGANGLSTDVENLPQIGPCSVSGEAVLGVAEYDGAIGANIGVFLRGSGYTLPITAGAAITAGQEIMTDAAGHAIPWVSPVATSGAALPVAVPVGYALDSAASGADCEIHLY